jgi:hypothetical protein
MPKPQPSATDPLREIAAALNRIADEFERYNLRNETVTREIGEAEAFRANYEREDPERRELHNFLTGEEAAVPRRRASRLSNRGGKKAPRPRSGRDGGGS